MEQAVKSETVTAKKIGDLYVSVAPKGYLRIYNAHRDCLWFYQDDFFKLAAHMNDITEFANELSQAGKIVNNPFQRRQ